MKTKDWITVGRITTVFGIKGWLKVHSYTQPALNLFEYSDLRLVCVETGSSKPLSFDGFQPHGKGFIAHIADCDDRSEAMQFTKKDIQVPQEFLPDLDQDDYYWHQLEGLKVWTSADDKESKFLLGEISHLLETGANDVLVVVPCDGSVDEQERLIPYVDQVVRNISLPNNTIELDWGVDY